MSLKVIFMGTPDFSVPTLKAVHQAGHEIVAVYTQPPRSAGRGMAERESPVHSCANVLGLDVFTPVNFKDAAAVDAFVAHQADVAVVVAYGLVLPKVILETPARGCFNVHASLLPRWRGAAPIQRAIMSGDKETGISIMGMEAGLDTGPVCLTHRIAIDDATTSGALHDTLSAAGAALMTDALARLEQNTLTCEPQPEEGVTYASKIEKREAHIDFAMKAQSVVRLIHGLSPFPGAWFEVDNGKKPERIKVLTARSVPGKGAPGEVLDGELTIACGDGAVQLLTVQRAGKKPVSTDAFLRGFDLPKGCVVGAGAPG